MDFLLGKAREASGPALGVLLDRGMSQNSLVEPMCGSWLANGVFKLEEGSRRHLRADMKPNYRE